MRIAVIGGGNIGTLMAGELASSGQSVRIVVSDPSDWSGVIDILSLDGTVIQVGVLDLVTSNLEEAVSDAEMVWITYPTFMLESVARKLLPILKPGVKVGVVPGNDAEFFFAEHVKRGAVLFGLQRVHSIARLKERGRSVYMLGRKPELQVAALPSAETENVSKTVEMLFDIPTIGLPNYLVETLAPSNPILHTSRIRSMFREWAPGRHFNRNILFYEEWDDKSSELILKCDDELQHVCRALERELGFDLSQVKSLREHYESPTAHAMTKKISGIPAFKGLVSPMKEELPGEWVPDFDSRYFRADFAYGLKAIKDIAKLVEVETPVMDDVYDWYVSISGCEDIFDGVPETLQELAELYV